MSNENTNMSLDMRTFNRLVAMQDSTERAFDSLDNRLDSIIDAMRVEFDRVKSDLGDIHDRLPTHPADDEGGCSPTSAFQVWKKGASAGAGCYAQNPGDAISKCYGFRGHLTSGTEDDFDFKVYSNMMCHTTFFKIVVDGSFGGKASYYYDPGAVVRGEGGSGSPDARDAWEGGEGDALPPNDEKAGPAEREWFERVWCQEPKDSVLPAVGGDAPASALEAIDEVRRKANLLLRGRDDAALPPQGRWWHDDESGDFLDGNGVAFDPDVWANTNELLGQQYHYDPYGNGWCAMWQNNFYSDDRARKFGGGGDLPCLPVVSVSTPYLDGKIVYAPLSFMPASYNGAGGPEHTVHPVVGEGGPSVAKPPGDEDFKVFGRPEKGVHGVCIGEVRSGNPMSALVKFLGVEARNYYQAAVDRGDGNYYVVDSGGKVWEYMLHVDGVVYRGGAAVAKPPGGEDAKIPGGGGALPPKGVDELKAELNEYIFEGFREAGDYLEVDAEVCRLKGEIERLEDAARFAALPVEEQERIRAFNRKFYESSVLPAVCNAKYEGLEGLGSGAEAQHG